MADSVEEVLYDYVTSDTAFMAIVTGVYNMEAPADTSEPYVVMWLVSDPGTDTVLNAEEQGEARMQFDLWDTGDRNGLIRGTRIRGNLRKLLKKLSKVVSGYHVMVTGTTEQTIPRQSGTDPYHFVVDGVCRWRKE